MTISFCVDSELSYCSFVILHLLCTNMLIFLLNTILIYGKSIPFRCDLILLYPHPLSLSSLLLIELTKLMMYFTSSLNHGCGTQCLTLGVFSQTFLQWMNEWMICPDCTIIIVTVLGISSNVTWHLFFMKFHYCIELYQGDGKIRKQSHILPLWLTRCVTLGKLSFALL